MSCHLGLAAEPTRTWQRHTIDDSSRGADGVRVADINGDGLLDVTTGWEEGGLVRVYVNPGPLGVAGRWPAVTAGRVASPEDAVFADLDGDGAYDVISCCEGTTRTMYVHWGPRNRQQLLDPAAWITEPIAATKHLQAWMFSLPMQLDGRYGTDVVVGSKNEHAGIGWLEAPATPRDVSQWKYHRLCDAGWIMSLVAHDVDADGDQDIVASDRRGPGRGVFWLEHPGEQAVATGQGWPRHPIGASGKEAMFLTLADMDQDRRYDVLVTTWNSHLEYCRRLPGARVEWKSSLIELPFGLQHGKSVAAADIDLDGVQELITTNRSVPEHGPAVALMEYLRSPTEPRWQCHDIGGPEGSKFDLIELIDLDSDGDLDILTCEEVTNLGVIWYENPTR
jgi:hypothetical protein